MREYNQGEEYEEFSESNEELLDNEGYEDTESKVTHMWGMPIKNVIIIGVLVLLGLLVLFLFSTRKTKNDDVVVEAVQPEVIQNEVVVSEPVSSDSDMVWDDAKGMWVSSEESATEEVIDKDAILSSISNDEQIQLRKLGYTGDEIALALDNGFNVDELITKATELHDEEAAEALVRMSDSASEEFRYIIENSYFGQPGYEFISHKDDVFGTYSYAIDTFIINADYVKCPTYGSQLQLKCRVSEDLEVFYIVTPERFAELPEQGNIVLEIECTLYGEVMYVTSVRETDKTLESIDSSRVSTESIKESISSDAATEAETPVEGNQ